MSLLYEDAETDRVISSFVKGATRARNLVVEYIIEDIRVDLQWFNFFTFFRDFYYLYNCVVVFCYAVCSILIKVFQLEA